MDPIGPELAEGSAVDLELAGRFPPGADIDAAWAETIRLFSPEPAQ